MWPEPLVVSLRSQVSHTGIKEHIYVDLHKTFIFKRTDTFENRLYQVQIDILIVRITESLPTVKASETVGDRQAINASQNLIEQSLGKLFLQQHKHFRTITCL